MNDDYTPDEPEATEETVEEPVVEPVPAPPPPVAAAPTHLRGDGSDASKPGPRGRVAPHFGRLQDQM